MGSVHLALVDSVHPLPLKVAFSFFSSLTLTCSCPFGSYQPFDRINYSNANSKSRSGKDSVSDETIENSGWTLKCSDLTQP